MAKWHRRHWYLALCLISVARSPKRCIVKRGEPFVCHSSSNSVKMIFNARVKEPFMISVGVFSFSPPVMGFLSSLTARTVIFVKLQRQLSLNTLKYMSAGDAAGLTTPVAGLRDISHCRTAGLRNCPLKKNPFHSQCVSCNPL